MAKNYYQDNGNAWASKTFNGYGEWHRKYNKEYNKYFNSNGTLKDGYTQREIGSNKNIGEVATYGQQTEDDDDGNSESWRYGIFGAPKPKAAPPKPAPAPVAAPRRPSAPLAPIAPKGYTAPPAVQPAPQPAPPPPPPPPEMTSRTTNLSNGTLSIASADSSAKKKNNLSKGTSQFKRNLKIMNINP